MGDCGSGRANGPVLRELGEGDLPLTSNRGRSATGCGAETGDGAVTALVSSSSVKKSFVMALSRLLPRTISVSSKGGSGGTATLLPLAFAALVGLLTCCLTGDNCLRRGDIDFLEATDIRDDDDDFRSCLRREAFDVTLGARDGIFPSMLRTCFARSA